MAEAPFRPVQAFVCPVVVGREREVGLLHDRVSAAQAGRGGVVGLVGDAGVGKTRMCREARRIAEDAGLRVLFGRAVPGPAPVPYRPLTEALLRAFRSSGPPQVPELAGFEGHLGRLVPAWQTAGASTGADESPVLLAEAVVRLLRVLGDGAGALLILEDLHWADAETLDIVEYLADALRQEPTLALCTSRPTGSATDVLTRLQRRDPAALVGIEPLDDGEVERVIAACLATEAPPGDAVAVVTSHSEGNPFLVEELLAGLVASGALTFDDDQWATSDELKPAVPFSFGDSIRQRLAALDATARRVVSAAAVLGRHFDWELLPGVAELDGKAVVDGLRKGVDEQLLEVEGSGFRFRHALTREAVLGELLPPERRELSNRAWPAIERAHPGLPGPWCELAAELAEASGDVTQAALRLVESASRALASGALASAEAVARRAIRLAAGDGDVTNDAEEVLVETLALAGKPDQANAIGSALVERLADRGAPPDRQAALLVALARAAIAAGDHAVAEAMSDRARRFVDAGEVDEAIAARVEAVAAHVALDQARLDDAAALARSAIDRAAATGQPAVECEALEVMGRVERTSGHQAGREWFARAAALAERHGLTSWLLRARHELALEDWANGRTRPLTDVRELAARHGALVTVAVMDLALADFALSSFDRGACLEAAARCVDASRRYGLATLWVGELWLAAAHALAGDEAQMEAATARALARDPDDPRILGDLWGRVRATLAIVRDDRQQLRIALDRQMDYARVAPVTTSIFPNRIMWALIHTIDDDDHGEAARAELAAATNLNLWPQYRAGLEVLAAIAAGRAGKTDEAAARFATASVELRASKVATGTVHYHHLLVAEVAIRDGWGDPAPWLRASEAFFAGGGYDVVARVCRALLVKVGAPAPRRGRGDSVVAPALRALGVTSREVDVLLLVAEGLSNRVIADRLSLSPKTVERHLASLFDRTGIRNRKDLGEFARTQTG